MIHLSLYEEFNNFRRAEARKMNKNNKMLYCEALHLFSLWGDAEQVYCSEVSQAMSGRHSRTDRLNKRYSFVK
jgi:hypothetical protein